MNQTEALQRLLHLGSGNYKELATAMQAVKMQSPIADVRVLRALSHGVRDLGCQDTEPGVMGVIGQLAAHKTRGRLPDGGTGKFRAG
jgi:phage-related protein